MNNEYRVLILTDHSNHSSENSLYVLSQKMLDHPLTGSIDIVTRGIKENDSFFSAISSDKLYATEINNTFNYSQKEHPLSRDYRLVDINSYDLVWLRLPPPLSKAFLDFISKTFSGSVVINKPKSIYETGTKSFLTNFESVCPPMKICREVEDIIEFSQKFTIVLKPFREYGGKGIVKVNGDEVSSGQESWTLKYFCESYKQNSIDYLAVKYLKNVTQGDKRIVVVNGEILGASLRLPAKDSWLCNVAMGGSSNMTEIESEELEIIKAIDPLLSEMGIVMYGVDTLVGDNGKRVLSEINTTSIGGLPQIAAMRNEPLVEKAIDLIWDYYEETIRKND